MLALAISPASSILHGQQAVDEAKFIAEVNAMDLEAERSENQLVLNLGSSIGTSVSIPRLAAPLRSIRWADSDSDGIQLIPEQDRWTIRWEHSDSTSRELLLDFETKPQLLSELQPIAAQSDGSFWLPAHRAVTVGEKIRYEPQNFKNTIGYWTGKEDYAFWDFRLQRPGKFNVAILQGCGQGQGGSTALIAVARINDSLDRKEIQFQVEETGHFQNFRWRHLGELELSAIGNHRLTVRPLKIVSAALMDVRAIHLIRNPSAN